jgi:DNA replication protein DnaC
MASPEPSSDVDPFKRATERIRARLAAIPPEQIAAQEAARREQEQRQENNRRRGLWDEVASELGPRLCEARLSNYQADCEGQKVVLAALQKYGEGMEAEVAIGNGILLFGPAGTGKDHLLAALSRVATLKLGFSVRWCYGPTLFSSLRDRIDSEAPESRWVDALVRPEILVLSDPCLPGGLSSWQATMLLAAVDRRYRLQRPVWSSLNVVSGAQADELMTAPLIDRLKDNALAAYCDWPSFRKSRLVWSGRRQDGKEPGGSDQTGTPLVNQVDVSSRRR